MIIIENLSKSILDKQLFQDLSLTLNTGDRLGVIGQNGCGKSTLLRIVSGLDVADDGVIQTSSETVYLVPQQIESGSGETIDEYLNLSERQEAWRFLSELGLIDLPIDTLISKLSGGEKTKLILIKAFSGASTTLLLDEPTNHLDVKTRAWLMSKIQEYQGTIIVVSHDRELLNKCVTQILEIDPTNQRTALYSGNYDYYKEQKSSWKTKQEDAHRIQQGQKRKMEQWLVLKRQEASAHPDPRKGRQIRQMERRLQREVLDQEILKPKDSKAIKKAGFAGSTHGGKIMLRLKGVQKSFDERQLISDASFEIRGSEHVRLVGPNGSGKSTLLKMVIGEIASDSGTIEVGANVQVGYFAQQLENLDPDKTVLETFLETDGKTFAPHRARAILGAYLFIGDSVKKKISQLSYGERVRLQLAQILQQENQLLILDEPTNHLDIPSREVIEDALRKYQGAILIVSHDEYFLDSIGVDSKLELNDSVITEKPVK